MDPTAQLPAGAAQALQQSGLSAENLTQILAQLATMSPDEVSEALQSLGINIDPDTIHETAQTWVDEHSKELAAAGADNSAAADAEEQSPDEGTPSDPDYKQEAAEGDTTTAASDDADAAQEGSEAMAQASPEDMQQARAPVQSGGMPMPMRGGGGNSGRGSPMDELISAQMMQGAAGNPNARVPSMGVGGGRGGGAVPMPGPAAGEAPGIRDLIASTYRSKVGMGPGTGSGSSKIGVPLGPRTGGEAGATSSPLTRIKSGKKIK